MAFPKVEVLPNTELLPKMEVLFSLKGALPAAPNRFWLSGLVALPVPNNEELPKMDFVSTAAEPWAALCPNTFPPNKEELPVAGFPKIEVDADVVVVAPKLSPSKNEPLLSKADAAGLVAPA